MIILIIMVIKGNIKDNINIRITKKLKNKLNNLILAYLPIRNVNVGQDKLIKIVVWSNIIRKKLNKGIIDVYFFLF